MATLAQHITTISGYSYLQEVGTPVELTDEAISEIKYSVWRTNVLERNNGEGVPIKYDIVVYDYGGASEEVLSEYVPSFNENLSGYQALLGEIESITNIQGYFIKELNLEQQTAIVCAKILVPGSPDTIDIKWYLVYVDSGLQHAEINNPEEL